MGVLGGRSPPSGGVRGARAPREENFEFLGVENAFFASDLVGVSSDQARPGGLRRHEKQALKTMVAHI